MLAPNFRAADFLSVMQALLPRGRVWSRDLDTVQTKVLSGLAPSYERQTARANFLLTDAFPSTAFELLPEWESSLGLPDPCSGDSPSLQARRALVIARLTNLGGQSIDFFVAFAETLEYDISIAQHAPARAGQARADDACNGVDWAHAWAISLTISTVTYARAGQATAGEPLASWGNEVLQCQLEEIKPAQSILIFRYVVEVYDNTVVNDFGEAVITSDGYSVVI